MNSPMTFGHFGDTWKKVLLEWYIESTLALELFHTPSSFARGIL